MAQKKISALILEDNLTFIVLWSNTYPHHSCPYHPPYKNLFWYVLLVNSTPLKGGILDNPIFIGVGINCPPPATSLKKNQIMISWRLKANFHCMKFSFIYFLKKFQYLCPTNFVILSARVVQCFYNFIIQYHQW